VCFDIRLGGTLHCACPLEVDRAEHAVGGMSSVGVVFVDERGYCVSGLFAGGKVVPAEQLELQGRVERFRDGVVQSRQLRSIPSLVSELFG
jgi:hypothetical protein